MSHEDTKTRRELQVSSPLDARTERIAREVVDAAYRVHTALGPGLLESVYEACLAHELTQRGYRVETQVVLPIIYEGMEMPTGLRLDLLVERCVVVEIKAVDQMLPAFDAQLLTYLKLTGCRLVLS